MGPPQVGILGGKQRLISPYTKLKNKRGKKRERNLLSAGPGIKTPFGFVCFVQHFLLTLKMKLRRELTVPGGDGGSSGNHT